MSCPEKLPEPLCVIRGNPFEQSVGLSAAYSEVVENPSAFQGSLVFREAQSDDLPNLLTLTATPEANPDYDPDCAMPPNTPAVYMHFRATAVQTSQLPAWDLVAFCEIVGTGISIDPNNIRLFNADIRMSD